MKAKIISLLTALVMSGGIQIARASSCVDNPNYNQNLPTVIGKEDQVGKFPFALKCDTVFVRRGITAVVYPGTMLFFTKPSLNNVIKVEGTLYIKGNKNSYVSLSGSLDSTLTGFEAGNHQWGGIEIAEGGRLEIEYAGFMRAPTPITAFSRDVKLLNTWFKGSSGMILPDGSLYPMETAWHAINELDLNKDGLSHKGSERPADAISEKEKEELLAHGGSGFWTWKKIAGGAAAVTLVGVGAGFLLSSDKSPAAKTSEPMPKSTMDSFPLGLPSE